MWEQTSGLSPAGGDERLIPHFHDFVEIEPLADLSRSNAKTIAF